MKRLVYILAASHSGSTLLAMLLGSHPDACTVGELKLTIQDSLDRYRCSCGELLAGCVFWAKVKLIMKSKGIDFQVGKAGTNILDTVNPYIRFFLRPLHRNAFMEILRDIALSCSPEWHRHFRSVQQHNRALLETIHEITGAKVIIDSSKVGLRLKYLLKDPEIDIRVIRLIRDGRGVALTYMDPMNFADAFNPDKRAGGSGGNRNTERHSMIQAAHEWRRSNEEAEAIVARLDRSKWIEVRYENLCTNSNEVLRKIYGFLELSSAKIVINFRSVQQHVIGNGMRLDSTTEISCDERWRTILSPKDILEFEKVAGKLNNQYGYQ
jgi:hypothetical protein